MFLSDKWTTLDMHFKYGFMAIVILPWAC